MINKANQFKFLTLIALVAGFIWGNTQEVSAQTRDPFEKAPFQKQKDPNAPKPTTTTINKDGKQVVVKAPPAVPVPVAAPAIQDRINYFKEMRRIAAEKGEPLPKVTSVLTLDEMSISGIFRTPRGYAAIIQATPISLSYTIYPGEKFFNGQLVAIEENRLVFRKVVKMSNGKFLSSEENKTLRLYSEQEEMQGTAPVEATAKGATKAAEAAQAQAQANPQTADPNKPAQPASIVSPLDEMNRQPAETPKSAKDKSSDKNKKGKSSSIKKPAKVAANNKQ